MPSKYSYFSKLLLGIAVFSLVMALGLIWGNEVKAAYRGERVSDTLPPAAPSQIKLQANAFGQVTITWLDPVENDLSDIVIERDHFPDAGTISNNVYALVAPGAQSFIDVNLKLNEVYLYRLKVRDFNGNVSLNNETFKILVPSAVNQTTTGSSTLPSDQSGQTGTEPKPTESLRLVKTASSPTVYLVYNGQSKHAFPNETVFKAWFSDFSRVELVADSYLAGLRTGNDIKMRAGTYLVKKQSDPRVYALEPDGNLRWISSEQIAVSHYGNDWNKRIVDVPDSFLNNYVQGKPIIEILPDASVIQYQGHPEKYYIEDGTKGVIPDYAYNSNLFQDKFVVKDVPTNVDYPLSTNYQELTLKVLFALD